MGVLHEGLEKEVRDEGMPPTVRMGVGAAGRHGGCVTAATSWRAATAALGRPPDGPQVALARE